MTKEQTYSCTDCQYYAKGNYCYVTKDNLKEHTICAFFEGIVNAKL